MGRRLIVFGMAAAVAILASSGIAAGGGWAVTVVDAFEPPTAGQVLDVSFTILQHGQRPVDVDGVELLITAPDGRDRRVAAQPTGEIGRYRVGIELPDPGRYEWTVVQGGFGPQDLGGFDVAGTARSSAGPAVATAVGVAGAAGLAALGVRRRRQLVALIRSR